MKRNPSKRRWKKRFTQNKRDPFSNTFNQKFCINPKLIGSGFKVQGLPPIETAQNIDQIPECLP